MSALKGGSPTLWFRAACPKLYSVRVWRRLRNKERERGTKNSDNRFCGHILYMYKSVFLLVAFISSIEGLRRRHGDILKLIDALRVCATISTRSLDPCRRSMPKTSASVWETCLTQGYNSLTMASACSRELTYFTSPPGAKIVFLFDWAPPQGPAGGSTPFERGNRPFQARKRSETRHSETIPTLRLSFCCFNQFFIPKTTQS